VGNISLVEPKAMTHSLLIMCNIESPVKRKLSQSRRRYERMSSSKKRRLEISEQLSAAHSPLELSEENGNVGDDINLKPLQEDISNVDVLSLKDENTALCKTSKVLYLQRIKL
jgi:hypothetical protein